MSCVEITTKLELMADDELSSEQAAQALAHIDSCANCRDNWYSILQLRQAIKDKSATFAPSADFEGRLIAAIRQEASAKSKTPLALVKGNVFDIKRLIYAAAALAVFAGAAAVMLHTNADSPTAAPAPPQIASRAVSAPASLDDAIKNFDQYLANARGKKVDGDQDLAKLSAEAGFPVTAMKLDGFKLAAAQMVTTSMGKTPLVRLCYIRNKGKLNDSIICYQAAGGKLIANGLNEHHIDGRTVCCGQKLDKSIVFIPEQDGQPNEVLLLGTIAKSDLMDLVLSSS